ncbi:MAG: phage holin family protein [Candidatus Latescibacterota bacterium]
MLPLAWRLSTACSSFCFIGCWSLLSLPFIIVTLGLFLVVINAILLWITDKLIEGFEIDSFLHTIIASLVISFFDIVFRWVLPGS